MDVSPQTASNALPLAASSVSGEVPLRGITAEKRSGSTVASQSTSLADAVNISAEGKKAAAEGTGDTARPEPQNQSPGDPLSTQLSEAELQQLRELKLRDQEVRTHEQAHLSAAGQHAAGGPTYTYQRGPDGKRYAVGGEVPIDVGKEATPEETLQKMEQVKRAALSPAEPSSADRQIAARASMLAAQARQEILLQQQQVSTETLSAGNAEETSENSSPQSSDPPEPINNVRNSGGMTISAMITSYSSMQAAS